MRILTITFAVLILILRFSFAQQPECDYRVDIITSGEKFDKDNFKWRMKAVRLEGSPTNITGRARIESAGKLIKEYNPWTSDPISKQKTSSEYSPNLKEGEYKLTAEINTECNDTNKENNIDIKLITIKSGNAESIDIPVVNNNPVLKLNIESQLADNASPRKAENAENSSSNENGFRDQVNHKETNVTCPIQENASKDSKPIPTSNVAKENVYESVFESSNEKAKNLIVYLLFGTSILLNVVLIWKR